MSPYVYCSGNPVNRIDPDGRWDIPKWDQDLQKISNAASSANSNLTGIATAKVSVSTQVATKGASINVGGVKLGARVDVISVSGSVSTQNISANASVAKGSLIATLPDNTSAKASINIMSSTVSMDTKSNITTKSELVTGNARMEKGDNVVSSDNQSIGVGIKAGPVQVDASLNVVKMFDYAVGMVNFVGTVISTKISEYLPNISQDQILNKK